MRNNFYVTIIIPIFKVERYILRCLESVSQQTYNQIECILVNDCTPDCSFVMAKDFVHHYNGHVQFKLVEHQVNKGLSEARNTGVKESTGDYIYFLDSDDAIPNDAIDALVHTCVSEKYPEVIYGRTIGVSGNGFFANVEYGDLVSYYDNKDIFFGVLNDSWYRIACNKLIKRSIFTENKTFFEPGILHEDELWSFQIATYIDRLILCDKITYYYYIGDSNSINRRKPTQKTFKDVIRILEIETTYLEHILYKKELSNFIVYRAYATYYSIIRHNLGFNFTRNCKRRIFKLLSTIEPVNISKETIPWYMRFVYRLY